MLREVSFYILHKDELTLEEAEEKRRPRWSEAEAVAIKSHLRLKNYGSQRAESLAIHQMNVSRAQRA